MVQTADRVDSKSLKGYKRRFLADALSGIHRSMKFIFEIYIVLCFCVLQSYVLQTNGTKEPSIVLTMISRDEGVNFKSNLALWLPIVDYFTILVDNRTIDDSHAIINQILEGRAKGYKIIDYVFDGFGSSRTLSLREAWKHFPQATHVIIGDPDWKPNTGTMAKSDLDFLHTVFRFTVYDRSGVTYRQMDWMLLHREGLKMRYNLHEVLDISLDSYFVKSIPWVSHEIEQKGSWHTTVGHNNSFSLKRLMFDVSLLEKDLVEYGHDPHTHNYLGITYHGIVEELYKLSNNVMTTEVEKFIALATKYLVLRATSSYESEFAEERLYSAMLLGSIYINMFNDLTNGEKWMQICYTYDESRTECAIHLARIKVALGDLTGAVEIVTKLIRLEPPKRAGMLNFINVWTCTIPTLALEILSQHLYSVGSHHGLPLVKYLLALRRMIQDENCGRTDTVDQFLSRILFNHFNSEITAKSLLEMSTIDLCSHIDLLDFLRQEEYNMHPCVKFKEEVRNYKECVDFNEILASPLEELQINQKKELVGGAIIHDIIHHAYKGNASYVYNLGRAYRVLFAEYFSDRNIYSFLGYVAKSEDKFDIEIVVVTPDEDRIINIMNRITTCLPKDMLELITFIKSDMNDYIPRINIQLSYIRNHAYATGFALDDVEEYGFDYIEYFGGPSLSPFYEEHFIAMANILNPRGIAGVTYFSENKHSSQIRRLIQNRNSSFSYPFSYEPARLVRYYLDTYGFSFLKSDNNLVQFLAADFENVYNFNSVAHNLKLMDDIKPSKVLSFTKEEFKFHIVKTGLQILNWFPNTYVNPYDNMEQKSFRRIRQLGAHDSFILEDVAPSFRYTSYVCRHGADIHGRAYINENFLQSISKDYDIYVIPRTKSLGLAVFNNTNISIKAFLRHYSSSMTGYSIVVSSAIVNEVNKIFLTDDKYTYDKILEACIKSFAPDFAPTIKNALINFLDQLEKMSIITIWYQSKGPTLKKTINYVKKRGGLRMTYTIGSEDFEIDVDRKRIQTFNAMMRSKKNVSNHEVSIQQDIFHNNETIRTDGTTLQKNTNTDDNVVQKPKPSGFEISGNVDNNKGFNPIAKSGHSVEASSMEAQKVYLNALKSHFDEIIEIPLRKFKRFVFYKDEDNVGDHNSTCDITRLSNSLQVPEYRKLSCKNSRNQSCLEPVKVYRKTGQLMYYSYNKLEFDIAQLKYIYEITKSEVVNEAIQSLHKLIPLIADKKNPFKLTDDEYSVCNGFVNRIIQVKDSTFHTNFIPDGAIEQLKLISEVINTIDFIVLDEILHEDALKICNSILLQSTIWFDTTNGVVFASHHNDGLFHNSFKSFSDEIARSLSSTINGTMVSFNVVKYFVCSMAIGSNTSSPVMVASIDQVAAIVWLNNDLTSEAIAEHDGIRVYEAATMRGLWAKGYAANLFVHPDFVGNSSQLLPNIQSLSFTENMNYENIQRVNNRLVIIGSLRPFVINTGDKREVAGGFESKYSLALVIILGTKKKSI